MYITGCVGEWILITSLKWNKKQKGVNDNNNKINKVYPKANKNLYAHAYTKGEHLDDMGFTTLSDTAGFLDHNCTYPVNNIVQLNIFYNLQLWLYIIIIIVLNKKKRNASDVFTLPLWFCGAERTLCVTVLVGFMLSTLWIASEGVEELLCCNS